MDDAELAEMATEEVEPIPATPVDPHDATNAEAAIAPADDQAQAWALRAELDDVERALARLDEGTYGTCDVCGATIDDEVLAAEPQRRRCDDHPA